MVFKMFTFGLSLSQSIQRARRSVQSSDLGPPLPPPPASFSPPLDPKGGKQYSPAGEGWGYPVRTTEQRSLELNGPDVWFGEATTTFVAGRRSKILTWMGTGPFQQRYVHKFYLHFRKFYFLSDEILTVFFLRSCSMPSEERKFYCNFA
jgi:hypothetical protein